MATPLTARTFAAELGGRINESISTFQAMLADEGTAAAFGAASAAVLACLQAGGTVFFAGNGGSSAEAQHLSAELLGRFYRDRPPLPSVNLSDNTAAVTAIANDYSYEEIFSRQLSGLGKPGDVFVGMSTSGGSKNVIAAVAVAKERGITTIGFTGGKGGPLAEVVDIALKAPSVDTARIQECHLILGHTLCEVVEAAINPLP